MRLILIAAIDENWGIGNKNDLLFHIPEDQKFFRDMTMGHQIVLGRKTLEGFPKGKPLKGRTNIILSSDTSFQAEDAKIVHSKKELLETLKELDDDIYVVGGETIYNMLYPYCDIAYITKVHQSVPADRHFPNLDKETTWTLIFETEVKQFGENEYVFCKYENTQVKPL